MTRVEFWWKSLLARLRPSGVTVEFGPLNTPEIILARSDRFAGAFEYWWMTNDSRRLSAGDELEFLSPEFGKLVLRVIDVKVSQRHGLYGTAVPSDRQQHAVMLHEWSSVRYQAEHELRSLRGIIYGLIASRGGTCEVPVEYLADRRKIMVDIQPLDDRFKIWVTVEDEKGEKTRHG